jgi:hypothetical protein
MLATISRAECFSGWIPLVTESRFTLIDSRIGRAMIKRPVVGGNFQAQSGETTSQLI